MGVVWHTSARSRLHRRPQRMDINRMYQVLVMAAACMLAQSALAAGNPQGAALDPGVVLLQKVQAAARSLDYSGVYTYQQGATMASSRIIHIVDGTGERERIEMLDGAPREYLRHNDITQCLVPEKKLIVLEHRHGDRFPALLLNDGKSLADNYLIRTAAAPNRIAGRECTIVELIPKDGHRYGYRICTDTKTHLLLKAQTISGSQGAIIDQISFTSLQIGKAAAEELASNWDTRGWKLLETPMSVIDLPKEGWRIPFPPGFQALTQVSRPMKAGKKVSQLVVSDGMAAISVFIEPFDAAHDSPLAKGAMHKGAMNVFRTRIDNYWLTALGEVPSATLREIAEHTEYVPRAGHK